jgi:acyl-coenzyme A thioesterase PaaI-like protein
MPESLRTRISRWGFNFFPAYRGTGARITAIAGDWREVRIKLPLNWRTRNYVGTIYGGSMYAAVDPIYMLMLIKVLGPEYVVWDKAASIRFKKPGTSTLFAQFILTEEEISAIKNALSSAPSVERIYLVELVDAEGVVHASIEKTVYIRRKDVVVENNERNRT